MYFLAKYGVQTDIQFAMVKRGVVDLAATADWTPATGDTKISKDGGNFANTTNNPAAVGGTGSVGWKLTLTATELQAAEVNIQIVDSATKAVEDQFITVYTYGNASAKLILDHSTTIENQVWDALRSSHVVGSSMGMMPQGIARDNTATAGAAGTITLDAGAPTTVDIFKGAVIAIYGGTGAGQARMISAYSAGRVATVVPNWITNPDATSKYIIHGYADPVIVGSDNKVILSSDAHSGVTIPTVTTLTNAPSDSSGVTTLLGRLTSTRAGLLDNLDAAITTRLATGTVASDVTAIKAMTDLLPWKKNTALNNFEFIMTDSTTHTVKTGIASFTCKESIDGAAEVTLTNSPTEITSGIYKINLTAGELNGKVITLRFSATGADDTIITIITSG